MESPWYEIAIVVVAFIALAVTRMLIDVAMGFAYAVSWMRWRMACIRAKGGTFRWRYVPCLLVNRWRYLMHHCPDAVTYWGEEGGHWRGIGDWSINKRESRAAWRE